jgi:pimeloyl-ACP methyl ester carboxylesterase
MFYLALKGYRCIAHDRRGHGRSSQPWNGNDMDTYAEDLKKIDTPTLILHGDDHQIVPIADSAIRIAKIVKQATLKVYKGAPHGMCTTHEQQINEDLLAFFEGKTLS